MGAHHLAQKSGNFGLKSNIGKVIFRRSESITRITPVFFFRSERGVGNFLIFLTLKV